MDCSPKLRITVKRPKWKSERETISFASGPVTSVLGPVQGRISSTCGSFGVTSGPAGAHTMLISLRTPNSPGR